MVKDWKRDFRTLKEMAKTKHSEVAIFKKLTEFVRSHSSTKQLSELFTLHVKYGILTTIEYSLHFKFGHQFQWYM